MRRLVQLALEADSFEVSAASNGLEALQQLDRDPSVDAIVLDLSMPVMDGRTFYRHLRARPSSIPVLLLSAYEAEAAQAELGAEAALAKPFDPFDLARKLRSLASTPAAG